MQFNLKRIIGKQTVAVEDVYIQFENTHKMKGRTWERNKFVGYIKQLNTLVP